MREPTVAMELIDKAGIVHGINYRDKDEFASDVYLIWLERYLAGQNFKMEWAARECKRKYSRSQRKQSTARVVFEELHEYVKASTRGDYSRAEDLHSLITLAKRSELLDADLEFLSVLMEEGSVTKAAEKLGVSRQMGSVRSSRIIRKMAEVAGSDGTVRFGERSAPRRTKPKHGAGISAEELKHGLHFSKKIGEYSVKKSNDDVIRKKSGKRR